MTVQRRDTERANSVSIQHHDHFLHSRYKYRRRGLMNTRYSQLGNVNKYSCVFRCERSIVDQ
ncbi:hypothetical protein SK128_002307 [Halocaridina rubra]|uniref:Uncharacterized protein n=1 Tax=Halocaridina rubra TaxID=373956 RepID=A0AAN8X146_HALRR